MLGTCKCHARRLHFGKLGVVMQKKNPDSPITFRVSSVLRRQLEQHMNDHDLVKSRFLRAAVVEKLRRDRRLTRRRKPVMLPQ